MSHDKRTEYKWNGQRYYIELDDNVKSRKVVQGQDKSVEFMGIRVSLVVPYASGYTVEYDRVVEYGDEPGMKLAMDEAHRYGREWADDPRRDRKTARRLAGE